MKEKKNYNLNDDLVSLVMILYKFQIHTFPHRRKQIRLGPSVRRALGCSYASLVECQAAATHEPSDYQRFIAPKSTTTNAKFLFIVRSPPKKAILMFFPLLSFVVYLLLGAIIAESLSVEF